MKTRTRVRTPRTWVRSMPVVVIPSTARCQVSCPPISATATLKRLRSRCTIERTTPRFCLSDCEAWT